MNRTICDNVADGKGPPGFGCGSGGAIKVTEGGTLRLENSTLSGNRTKRRGGGLHVSCKSTAFLTNCTISGNHATARGGGINAAGSVSLTHCTISGNTAKGILRSGAVSKPIGAGVYVRGTLHYSNTLIADHAKGEDCVLSDDGVIGINIHNLVEDQGCNPAHYGDPLLEKLADYGGDTQTRALLPDSPAVDAILASDCLHSTDQRGQPRPVARACDIGAFELQAE
jgi:predicted outer membrane repeat protein